MKLLFLDFETYSKVDLRKRNAYVYAEHPSTEVLCFAYTEGLGNPMILWHPACPETAYSVLTQLVARNDYIVAHNAGGFERLILKYVVGIDLPPSRFIDTMALAARLALPLDLQRLSEALGLKHPKYDWGKRLIHKLCKPRKPSKKNPDTRWTPETAPEDFQKFYEYCVRDLQAEIEVFLKLKDVARNKHERLVWELDQKINDRGLPVNLPRVRAAGQQANDILHYLDDQIREITGVGGRQRDKLLDWLWIRGVQLPNLQEVTIKKFLPECTDATVKRVLELRLELSKSTSVAKLNAFVQRTSRDGRLRGALQYHGAGPGRWAGRGVQIQNFPCGKGLEAQERAIKAIDHYNLHLMDARPMTALSGALRGMIECPNGYDLMVGDYAQIEARILPWLSGQSDVLAAFRKGEPVYEIMAARIFKKPLSSVTSTERYIGKRVVLGCGYQMGWERFMNAVNIDAVKDDLPTVSAELAAVAVDTFRDANSKTVDFWWELNNAAWIALTHTDRPKTRVGKLSFFRSHDDEWLWMVLPSGRKLAYYKPKIREVDTPWGEKKASITYMTINSQTRQWQRVHTYGGKLAENADQAIARDILVNGMFNLEKAGYAVIGTVHDEAITEIPDTHGDEEEFAALMCDLPAWAEGLPIKAKVYRAKRYRK